MARSRRLTPLAIGLAMLAVFAYVAVERTGEQSAAWMRPAPAPDESRPLPWGVVKVAVLTPPEVSDTGEGGDTLRQLTRPAPFVAYPDGTWRASLVEPGSDRAEPDGDRVWFRLRDGARWSDGAPITAADLRRTMDSRFVEAVDDADVEGFITVHLKQKLPDWRRLWSEGIEPPRPDVSGGPYVVTEVVSGLRTTLRRNDGWFLPPASPGGVELTVAADATQARLLLRDGVVDVYRSVEDTNRTAQLRSINNVAVERSTVGGAAAGLRLDNGDLTPEDRVALRDSLPRATFVRSLLAGEATLLDGLAGDGPWDVSGARADAGAMNGAVVDVGVPVGLPLAPLLTTTVANTTSANGGRFGGSSSADVLLDRRRDGPSVCWTCRFGLAEPELAAAADAGDSDAVAALQKRLFETGRYVPLWRADEVVAFRTDRVGAVHANGFSYGNAWGVERWAAPGRLPG